MSNRDSKHKSGKVRFDSASGSSRASTVGGSSTSSSHSGSQYTPHYNVNALQESMRVTIAQLDEWKSRALESEKREVESQARISALNLSITSLQDAQKDSQKEVRELRAENEALQNDKFKLSRKLEKYGSYSPPSSPDSDKSRRSESKRSPKPTDAEAHNAHLKERFNRTSDSSSEGSGSSKPPSSSKSAAAKPHRSGSGRRQSFSSTTAERYGPASPVSPTSGRHAAGEYLGAAPGGGHHMMAAAAPYPAQLYATPRTAPMPMSGQYPHAPSSQYVAAYAGETGNYQPHPLSR